MLLSPVYFSRNLFLFSLQTQTAEQELQQAVTFIEDQTRTNDDHERKISEVFEKAEPLKVRIKA